jgi:hypothetical protein
VTEQRPECRDLVVIGVAAVIDDDIERSEFVRQPLKKFRVALPIATWVPGQVWVPGDSNALQSGLMSSPTIRAFGPK